MAIASSRDKRGLIVTMRLSEQETSNDLPAGHRLLPGDRAGEPWSLKEAGRRRERHRRQPGSPVCSLADGAAHYSTTYLAFTALGLSSSPCSPAWTNSRCDRRIYEQSLAIQRLRAIFPTSRPASVRQSAADPSVGRPIKLKLMSCAPMSQLAEGLADTRTVVQRFGKEVHTALQSKEVKDLLQGQAHV
jgi:hypothetical protein